MNYYAVFLPMKDEEKSTQYRDAHLTYLEKLYAQGQILTYGRFSDGSGGLVVYKAPDLETAQKLAAGDPFITMGARDMEVKEWVLNESTLNHFSV
ncbi:YciI family protein [Fictibacillus iocasae]|uniref:YciI family protein n=1 Tax=Fictibacillus iocasae TaxID=2715437 RepID=A0ABW2NLI4_9BACL